MKSLTEVQEVFDQLSREFPSHRTELRFESPFQLLVAVILSAQCTDARVNQTTPTVFEKYPTPEKLSKAKLKDVERLIHSCGFYRQKAVSIISVARDLLEKMGGKVPQTMEELTQLRGVGRKTASVVLNQVFDIPAIAVDTHVRRVSNRLGWTKNKDPVKIETDLKNLIPKPLWSRVNGLLILHGRRVCQARKPLCSQCPITTYCDYYRTSIN